MKVALTVPSTVVMAGPGYDQTPASFFEWDGSNLIAVPSPPNAVNDPSFVGHMVILPTGDVLFTDYSGVFDLGPSGYENALARRFPATPPLRLAPRFVTSDARYQWLTRLQCVGIGQVDMAKLQVDYDLYAATAGEPIFPPSVKPISARHAQGRTHG